MKTYFKVLLVIPKKLRKKFFLTCILSTFVAFIELIGVAAILPLVSIISDPNYFSNNVIHKFLYDKFLISSQQNYLLFFSILTILFFLFRASINYLFVSVTANFSFEVYKKYQSNTIKSFIESSYINFINNTKMGDFLKIMTKEIVSLPVIISSFMIMLSELILFIVILIFLLSIDYKITLSVFFMIAIAGFINLKIISKKIIIEGKKREKIEGEIYSNYREIYSSFKLLKFLPSLDNIYENIKKIITKFSNSNIRNQKLQNIPRITMETSAFIIVCVIILFLGLDVENIRYQIPNIAFFLLALFRILPSINRLISNHHVIVYSMPAIDAVNNFSNFTSEDRNLKTINFKDEIKIENLY